MATKQQMGRATEAGGAADQISKYQRAVREVASSDFAGRFGHWSFEAQTAPVKVVNHKTGRVLGYFVAPREFSEFVRLRERLPRALYAWELDDDMIAELKKPLPADYPDLDHLMDD